MTDFKKAKMTQAELKNRDGATEVVQKILRPLFSKSLNTLDMWVLISFTVMGTGEIVFLGQSSCESATALHIFMQGSGKLAKVREVKGLCKHEDFVYLEPVKVKDQEFLAVSCADCSKIRLYDFNTDVVTTAFYNSNYRPGLMSAGEDGVLYVVHGAGGIPVLKLNTEQIPFTGPHGTIQSGMEGLSSMIHIPAPYNLLVFNDHTVIRVVSTIRGKKKWEFRGMVEGRVSRPHGMFFSQDHQALLVADGSNSRIFRLDPWNGSVTKSIQFDYEMDDILDLFIYQQMLIVEHGIDSNYKISIYAIE